ncbi:uncharacterized protein LOC126324527 [Schistocerca gregaria]|uniref:uncharacterized protein LOC126324527 n=1 Tax=Schistocerca gregaria TaxID=7010 RepID=UPI00211E1DC0|nr:uncharacterized protein LOC126324527 [Schistocerca gregaria]
MQQILPVINKIQDALALAEEDSFIDLPQIVVVGSQSSGKSSVLESIVGRDFLPRGVGIVTRCPLILQLINLKRGEGDTEWGEFLHLPDKKFTNFLEIRREIEAETNHIVGGKGDKAISSKPINLRIYSPYVPTLTMVDLPGLTKVAIGNQPHNIDVLIRDLVMKFIANSGTIILAISPANVDLANSDSLKLAREVDPSGSRTIGVLTKLDLMDQGTDAMPVLTGKVYPLKLGFVGVVNRSQQDINANRDIRDALDHEQEFFSRHPAYSTIKHKCGYPYLISRLNKVFLKEISNSLPRTIQLLQNNLHNAQEKVRSFGKPIDVGNRGIILLDVIVQFFNSYTASLDGHIPDSFQGGLYGGARLAQIFSRDLEANLDKMLSSKHITDQEIEHIIYNSAGIRGNIYFSDYAFSFLVKTYINSMREPIMDCLQSVYHELYNIVCDIQLPEFERFPAVRERIYAIYQCLLDTLLEPTKSMIDDVLNMEKKYINIYHPDFVRPEFSSGNPILSSDINDPVPSSSADKSAKSDPASSEHSPDRTAPNSQRKPSVNKSSLFLKPRQDSKESKNKKPFWKRMFNQSNPTLKPGKLCSNSKPPHFQVDLLKSLAGSYIDIVSKNMRDRIPKILTHFLINASKEKLQIQLMEALYKEELVDDLIVESSQTSEERKRYMRVVQMLESALSILTTAEF